MKKIKKYIKKLIDEKNLSYFNQIKKLYYKMNTDRNNIILIFELIRKVRLYDNEDKIKSLSNLFKNVELKKNDNKYFYYSVDFLKSIKISKSKMDNLCIDYSKVLNNSLNDLMENVSLENEEFHNDEIKFINIINNYIDKIANNVNKSIADNLLNIKDKKAESFYEAIQRILFFNMLLWQTGHNLNGFGRLDKILIPYYENDIKDGKLTKEKAKELLREFLLILHKDYKFKSSSLFGDTGQVIELGGIDINGNYLCNDLTYIFIELMEELKLPDPKVLVRVSKNMPRKLMEESLKCISTGIGCPLFANDDVIIEKLLDYGYDKDEAYNYGTSACWEPYIIGKASDQNNIKSLNFMIPLNQLLDNENLEEIKDYKSILKKYQFYLKEYINKIVSELNKVSFEKDPLLSLFIDDCLKNGKDISNGGAKYNDFGLTGVALSNVVNSLINIKYFVFDKSIIKLTDFNNMRKNNFDGNEELLKELKTACPKYGEDDELVVDLTNDIINFASNVFKGKKNALDGKYRFGLSSPNYITDSKKAPASFDGRKDGEPFNVHISTDNSNAYTELINFASKLDYGENRFNGNVVDFFVTPNFISDNFDKFVDFLMTSIKVGFFEMQMNVVSSAQLIEARKNPQKFPNLVVRVWGFSAYFKDLPDEYKDYLIERALKNESNS